MKILILTSRFPYPIVKGDKLRVYHQIKELSKRNQLVLCSLVDEPIQEKDFQEIKKYCTEIYTFNLSKFDVYSNMAKSVFNGLPIQISYFFKTSIKKKIHQIISKEQPDHIFVQLIRMTEYVKDVDIPKTLDYMDAFSANTERWAGQANLFLKPILKREANKVKKYERKVYGDFDNKVIISEQDKKLLPISKDIAVVPNGVDHVFFKPKDQGEKKYDLVFVGNMGYKPNIEAVKYLVHQILPLLHAEYPQIKLLIAGVRPSAEVKQLQNEHITVSGWIEDIRDAYDSALIFVAPLFIGAGLQNKILEAMSMGLPCITTTMVNNAIGAIAQEEIIVADTAQEFADSIRNLLEDEKKRALIRKKGQIFVEHNFSWTTFVNKLEHIFTT